MLCFKCFAGYVSGIYSRGVDDEKNEDSVYLMNYGNIIKSLIGDILLLGEEQKIKAPMTHRISSSTCATIEFGGEGRQYFGIHGL